MGAAQSLPLPSPSLTTLLDFYLARCSGWPQVPSETPGSPAQPPALALWLWAHASLGASLLSLQRQWGLGEGSAEAETCSHLSEALICGPLTLLVRQPSPGTPRLNLGLALPVNVWARWTEWCQPGMPLSGGCPGLSLPGGHRDGMVGALLWWGGVAIAS